MGLDYAGTMKLIDLIGRTGPPGRVLMLGRQRIAVQRQLRPAVEARLAAAGARATLAEMMAGDGFAEPFFAALGARSVEALDYSPYEGAGIVHDLNRPVGPELHARFDLILDGGTLEHVFEAPTALRSAFAMLAPGGIFVALSPGNGWFGHGFWQFGPELPWSFWSRGCGCEVLEAAAVPVFPKWPEVPLGDPAAKGQRLRLRGRLPEGRTYLYYAVRKRGAGGPPEDPAVQSDYARRWRAGGGGGADGAAGGGTGR